MYSGLRDWFGELVVVVAVATAAELVTYKEGELKSCYIKITRVPANKSFWSLGIS